MEAAIMRHQPRVEVEAAIVPIQTCPAIEVGFQPLPTPL
jgi:hypothetical protein